MSSNSFLYRQTPNLITMARIALVPVVLWLIVSQWESFWGRVAALVLLVLAASTDGIDGALARKRDLVSNLGKLLDPIGVIEWWITIAILVRELGITLYRLVIAKKRVLAASGGGKFKTVLQIIAISLAIAPFEFLGDWYTLFVQAVLWFTVAVTWYTGIRYLIPSK
jgi:CDP-diacylglycerol--glycerol-3-phosphate 3-phosphatidyltransferase